jgi:hemoglobin-like flavoprotein
MQWEKGILSIKVKKEQYDIVGAAFLWVLEQNIKEIFTTEIKEAWTITYNMIASVMLEAYSEPELN